MNLRPRPALAVALATALAGTAPLSAPAAADDTDEELVERCFTEALTDEEVQAGAVSELECYEVEADAPLGLRSSSVLAVLYDVDPNSGSFTYVTGTTCVGKNVVFGSGNTWDDRISSTDLWVCGNAKHWTNSNYTGSNQLVSGSGLYYMNATLDNQTSSIQYAP